MSRHSILSTAFSLVAGFTVWGLCAAAPDRQLTREQRLTAQRAIEQVYASHRIWPESNPQPKPPLSPALSDDRLAAKVDDYLRKSNALESIWKAPIGAAQLQAELDRMVRGSRAPNMLRELFAALGDDPLVIAETLARPKLADRLIRDRFAYDERFHGALRAKAAAALAELSGVDAMTAADGEYRVAKWQRLRDGVDSPGETLELDAEEWDRHLARLARTFGAHAGSLPLRRMSRLIEEEDAFVVTAVLSRTDDAIQVATLTWPKQTFDDWWKETGSQLGPSIAAPAADYVLVQPQGGACADDTWTTLAPHSVELEPRRSHTAVWTGSEMIIWGGSSGVNYSNSGARYDPALDEWTVISSGPNVPSARVSHTAVWTGSEMIVWGGADASTVFASGGRYDPASDSWQATSSGGVPDARTNHTAVWTGSRMIVWGGGDAVRFNSGGRYDPLTDTWQPTSTSANVPAPRQFHTAIWTGSRMVVWGGSDAAFMNTGGLYDLATDTWQPTSLVGAPAARFGHGAVFTGSRMVVWGGEGAGFLQSGGRYDAGTNTWQATSLASAPIGRRNHSFVWTGSRMIVWGGLTSSGNTATGARYDPAGDAWQATSSFAVPRQLHTAVWSGTELLVWGGLHTVVMNEGLRYDPSADTWRFMRHDVGIRTRRFSSAVWTGTEMIMWGGISTHNNQTYLNSGGRYDPATDDWTPTSTGAGVPSPRTDHTAVWTGAEMIVWGGSINDSTYLGTGGRYDPVTDSWLPTAATTGIVEPRDDHTAVWSGTVMIIWGGRSGGGCYSPESDSWTATSLDGAPTTYFGNSAVWTGSRMIVWGGQSPSGLQIGGGLYDPVTNSWTPISGTGAPAARISHTAVWTGSRMIVWGGLLPSSTNTGGLYDPVSNSWRPTPTSAGVPSARRAHSAVWTGSEMIVWGGVSDGVASTGGRYDPVTDIWLATTTSGAPPPRYFFDAVWTGSQMLVAGGYDTIEAASVLGAYCAVCPDPDGDGVCNTPDNCREVANPLQENADGDAAGDACDCDSSNGAVYPHATELCDGFRNDCTHPEWPSVPAGESDADGDSWRPCSNDCNESDPSIHPGAVDVCNGVDDNCDGSVDDLVAYYIDNDGDGWGDVDEVITCNPPPNQVPQGGDCDDSNPAVHPGANEVACNRIDDDCDGVDGPGSDLDGDGSSELCDNCPTLPNPSQLDSDSDGVGNACDNCAQVGNAGQANADGDESGDACDNCPSVYNHQSDDFEADGVGDACDNCPFDQNRSQADIDGDLEGDVCDSNDGLILLFRTEPGYIEWQQEAAYSTFNVYEGDLAILRTSGVYTQVPGSNPLAQRSCAVLDPFTEDFDQPPAGGVQFSLVSGITAGTEGSLGNDSSGVERPNTHPCP